MMKRIILILAAALCLLGGQARAEDAPAELPPELRQAVPEAAELVTGDAGESFGLLSGIRSLLEEALAGGRTLLTSGIRSAAAIMAGVILLGVVESAAPAGGELLERYGTAVGALWVTAMAAGDLNALIGLGRETITEISLLGKALLPALAAAEAASGGITAASVRQVAAVFFSGVLLTVIERILLPAVYLYIGVAAAAAVVEGEALERVGELLKKAVGWVLGGLLTVFVTYLTISGAVAGAADAHAVKLAKSAVSAAVPVVGGILSDAAESVLAGAGLLRGGDAGYPGSAGGLSDAVPPSGLPIPVLPGRVPGFGGGGTEKADQTDRHAGGRLRSGAGHDGDLGGAAAHFPALVHDGAGAGLGGMV